MTPNYYEQECGDLYEHFRQHYGKMSAQEHLLMEAQQYLHRCLRKGQYKDDLCKVRVIMDRLIEWHNEDLRSE